MTEIYRITDTILAKHGIIQPQPLPDSLRRELEDEARWEAEKIRVFQDYEQSRAKHKAHGPSALILAFFAGYGMVRAAIDLYVFLRGIL